MNIKKEKKDIIKIVIIAAAALALLVAVYKVFFNSTSSASIKYSDEEARLCSILSEIEGVGDVSVIINSEGESVGVVVVCRGADSIMVRSQIISAVRLATGATGENILIYKMNE